MGNLQGKVVLVTGSTTGIGRSIAEKCLAEGAHVMLHGRDEQRGRALAKRLGSQAHLHIDDLADPNAAQRLIDATIARFGRLDVLVNNAAWVVRSDIYSTTCELFDGVMATNVRAPFLLIQAALPFLIENGGCVANIGSTNSLGGERNLFAYSVSKGALLTLSKNLADALGPQKVRFFHFNVGWVLTENEYHVKLKDGLPEGWPEQLSEIEIPSGKMTSPEQIAEAVAFWISDRSRPFSGTVMELEQYPFAGRNPTRVGDGEEQDS
ncbi:MAG: SDR family oxidoreductase [Planctomycetales bacterium]|nr:SDR family oxidoreductase [Planctomycetales bacterium]MCA9168894.1 SDR family oxidoreductase [Planctomycetales bacterium]